jgi:sulfite reductase (NADPH) hemoprotein beta-component
MISDAEAKQLSKNEGLKEASNYLRGTILEGLADASTGAVSEDDNQILKFHGTYLQDDRDLRTERRRAKLEKAFCFMIRVRVPGGVCTPAQWLALDELSDRYANGTLKITNRQAFQFHGVLKSNLKTTMQGINKTLLDTIAACGDVNRNVMCNPNPHESAIHAEVLKYASAVSDHLTPRTRAYHEIWLDEKKIEGGEEAAEIEPIYGKTYLPRKFKTVFAIPPGNDVDIFAQDLGFIAIVEDGKLAGFNVTVGGGMGMSHGNTATYPRLADLLGFCTPEQAVDVAEKIVLVQRDYGDRSERKHARLKYTIDDRGIDWFRGEVEARLGWKLGEARPFHFSGHGERYGWIKGTDERWHFTLFIMSGRVKDDSKQTLKSALREIAGFHDGTFILTPNQNLVLAGVREEHKERIETILRSHKVDPTNNYTGLRLNSMSCVALPTCGLALAESERYLPDLVDQLDVIVEEAGLRDDEIVLRITGCPNGCGRPYLGEIGFVGRVPGKYNVYLGAGFDGARLNKLWKESVPQEEIPALLKPLLVQYAKERSRGERFGDFCVRAGIIKATFAGRNFHDA